MSSPFDNSPELSGQIRSAVQPDGPEAERETEANRLVADIDSYVAETDPARLDQAEDQLAHWQTPQDPFDTALVGNPSPNEAMVVVATLESEAHGLVLKSILDSEGIPSLFDSRGLNVLGGALVSDGDCWAHLLVPAHSEEKARLALAESQPLE